MKISYDFDGVLSQPYMQDKAVRDIIHGHDVYITTSRPSEIDGIKVLNEDLYDVAEKVGIPKENIRFTSYEDKYLYLKDFSHHYDDSIMEIDLINKHTSCKGILWDGKSQRN